MKLISLGSLTANEDVIAYGSVVKGNEAINTGEVAGDRVLPQSIAISDGELQFEQEAAQAENKIKGNCKQTILYLTGTYLCANLVDS